MGVFLHNGAFYGTQCSLCASLLIKKNGHIHIEKQNYRCLKCSRQFVLEPTQKIIDEKTKVLIRRVLLERISLEGVCRAFEVISRGDKQVTKTS